MQVSGDEEDVDAQLRRHLSFARQQTAAPGQMTSEDFGAEQAEAGADEGHVGAPHDAATPTGEVLVSVSEQAAVGSDGRSYGLVRTSLKVHLQVRCRTCICGWTCRLR